MNGILLGEWTKIRSVRSTMWTLLAAAVLMIAVGAGFSMIMTASWDDLAPQMAAAFDATTISLFGAGFATLATAVLGVLVISGEYRTGMIRTTFLAVPRRPRALAAKAAVLAVTVLIVTTGASLVSFLAGQALLAPTGSQVSLGDPGVLRAVLGAGLYLTASALFGLAVGALVRHAAGAIVAVISLIFVLPPMASALPGDWDRYVTVNAGQQIMATRTAEGALGPWAGFGVYCAWIAVTMIAAAILMNRRDA
ncbi:ABC transporter permease [Streptosporangium lutulentum]|uniref:ABC-type transport system involved in multi-copper enzyme maturation permease subunit n=1 Tax=Streptosporangium lutulentum TaxID=1461250 RepID=A0ABT9QKP0_9ACTN|nr:ABC transporter permease [Streptosporangium lutulentum]MDP9847318.1 ABC-type transport system involved in multi-copper enzyme maturation permease subunit [Streptosporangium lutulentum]